MTITSIYTSSQRLLRTVAISAAVIAATHFASATVTWKNIQFGGSFSQGYLESTPNNYPKTDSGVADFFNTSSLLANPPGVQHLGLRIRPHRAASPLWPIKI